MDGGPEREREGEREGERERERGRERECSKVIENSRALKPPILKKKSL